MSEGFADIAFPVKGETLPWDHSYALFSALCRLKVVLGSMLTRHRMAETLKAVNT